LEASQIPTITEANFHRKVTVGQLSLVFILLPNKESSILALPILMERIDVHCHAVPPGYHQYAVDNGHSKPDGMPALPVRSSCPNLSLIFN
jgi:hypothetical protein